MDPATVNTGNKRGRSVGDTIKADVITEMPVVLTTNVVIVENSDTL